MLVPEISAVNATVNKIDLVSLLMELTSLRLSPTQARPEPELIKERENFASTSPHSTQGQTLGNCLS